MKPSFFCLRNILKKNAGFALLPIILIIIVSGLFLTAGLSLISSKAHEAKYDTSKKNMEKAVAAIIGWSKETGRLPEDTEFFSVTGISKDSWLNDFVYVYDDNLTDTLSGGICGRQSTAVSSAVLSDIAFILISRGKDYQLDSTPNASGAFSGTADLSAGDLIKPVSLSRLQSAICFSPHQVNQLRILNNELPYTCEGEAYSSTLFSQGGMAPYAWSYSIKPDWLTLSETGNTCLCQGTPSGTGSYTLGIILNDAVENKIEKQFVITVYECEEDPTNPKKPKKPKKEKKAKKNK